MHRRWGRAQQVSDKGQAFGKETARITLEPFHALMHGNANDNPLRNQKDRYGSSDQLPGQSPRP